jgi:hypothetical protein
MHKRRRRCIFNHILVLTRHVLCKKKNKIKEKNVKREKYRKKYDSLYSTCVAFISLIKYEEIYFREKRTKIY